MTSYRIARVEEAIKKEISKIIQEELKDPRVGLTTVTSVKVSPDLKYATVYLDILSKKDERTHSLEGLENAKGFIKNELGKRLRLKFLPELVFKLDETIEKGIRISKIIEKIHEGKEKSNDK